MGLYMSQHGVLRTAHTQYVCVCIHVHTCMRVYVVCRGGCTYHMFGWLSGGVTPCRHLRPSSGREHTIVTYSVR